MAKNIGKLGLAYVISVSCTRTTKKKKTFIGCIVSTIAGPLGLLFQMFQMFLLRRRGHKLDLDHQRALVLDRRYSGVEEGSVNGSVEDKALADDESLFSDSGIKKEDV